MRWAFLGVSACAFASLWGVGPGYAMFAAFLVMFANFATFCILYDRPKNRARQRVEGQLRGMHPNADLAQRLATAVIATTDADRHLGVGPMTILNGATGLAGIVLLVWGIALRVF